MGASYSIQGGGNKANRKNGGRATEGLNANDPAAKEEGSLAAKSSNRICYGELQSGSMWAQPKTTNRGRATKRRNADHPADQNRKQARESRIKILPGLRPTGGIYTWLRRTHDMAHSRVMEARAATKQDSNSPPNQSDPPVSKNGWRPPLNPNHNWYQTSVGKE